MRPAPLSRLIPLVLVAALAVSLAVSLVAGCSAQAPITSPDGLREGTATTTGTAPGGGAGETTRAPSATVPATRSADETAGLSGQAVQLEPVTFAIIGDYGTDDAHARAVARLVAQWKPAYILTTGDDYYTRAGGRGTARYDESTGAHYGRWLKDITTTGTRYPRGTARINSFFPSMGNHDYSDARPSPTTYLTYFNLPGEGYANSSGNERYYDFVKGPVHFFVLNSNRDEPHGVRVRSRQAKWLQSQLASSTATWNVVLDHHPPYSSDTNHGSTSFMQWPFAEWGADVVVSGHAHTYERIHRNGIVYFVNGLGGASRYRFRSTPVDGSTKRYRSDWGAQKVTVSEAGLRFEFYNVGGTRIDSYRLSTWR